MRTTTNLPPFDGVATNSTAVCELPIGRMIHSIDLALSVLANANEIRVLVNGNIVQRYTAAQLNAMNQYFGYTAAGATSSILRIFFDRPGLANIAYAEQTAIRTGVEDVRGVTVSSVRVEVDIGGTLTTVAGTYESSFNQELPNGQHMLRYVQTRVYPGQASGENQIFDLPRGSIREALLDTLFLIPSANDINSFKVFKNEQRVLERSKELNERFQNDGGGNGPSRVPQSGYIAVDWSERGVATNSLSLGDAQQLELRFETSAALDLTALVCTLGMLQG